MKRRGTDWQDGLVGRLEAKIEKMPDHEIISLLGMNEDQMPYRTEADTADMVRRELRAVVQQRKNYRAGRKVLEALLAQLQRDDAK